MSEQKPSYQVEKASALSAFSGGEAGVAGWAERFPVAHRVYWQMRAALKERDGRSSVTHHRAAVLAIHEAFESKPERDRLGLPATQEDLADLLGVSARSLRRYREKYGDLFATTRNTVREQFIGHYYGRVFEALGESAATSDYQHSSDRRLFFQLSGDLTSRVDVTSQGERVEGVQIYLPDNGRDDEAADE